MQIKHQISRTALLLFTLALGLTNCQKLERPVLKELILDPDPPAYKELKSFWSFEDNLADAGENNFTPASSNITYIPGVTGKAAKIGLGGYILLNKPDTTTYPNEFKGIPLDTLKNLGSYTLSFWMNSAGPVQDGAQGVFAISHKSEFWGNLEIFLENWSNPTDASEAFLKIHMFNSGVSSGNGEQWNELKIPNFLNKWTHLAVTYNAVTSGFTVYADGVPTSINNKILSSGSYGKLKFNNVGGMVLGSFAFQTNPSLSNHGPEPWAKSLNGALDQFRIYNRALTPAEITDLFTTKK